MLKTTKIWNWHGAKVKIWIGAAFAISTGITGEFKNDFSSPKFFSVIHLIQKMVESDTVCWEINEKGFGDRVLKIINLQHISYHRFKKSKTPIEQLSYEVLTACSFGNAITILGMYRYHQNTVQAKAKICSST